MDRNGLAVDDTLRAFDMVRQIIREAAASCDEPKVASMIASAKTVAAIVAWREPIYGWRRRSINGETDPLVAQGHRQALSTSRTARLRLHRLTTT